ncbi:MAG: hypothetical protein ACOCWR_03690 [Oceanidesulfovibrio sp.]
MSRRDRRMSIIRHIILCITLAATAATAWPAHAEINMWEDEEGVLILDSRRAPREQDALVISDYEIKIKPLPENVDVDEFHRVYKGGTSLLNQLLTDLKDKKYDPANRARLVGFNSYLNIKAPDLELPPSVRHRVDSFEGIARVAHNMVEGQRDQDEINRLRAKSLFCNSLATKLKWDIWIRTYEAPIDIVKIDESLCVDH